MGFYREFIDLMLFIGYFVARLFCVYLQGLGMKREGGAVFYDYFCPWVCWPYESPPAIGINSTTLS